MKKHTKIIALIATVALTLSLFTGCSLFDKSPKTPEELLVKAEQAMQEVDNFKVNLDADFGLTMELVAEEDGEAGSIKFELPLDISMFADVNGKKMHGEMEMDGKMKYAVEMGGETMEETEDMEQSAEFYAELGADEATVYQKDSETDAWIISEEEFDMEELFNMDSIKEESALQNAAMEKTENGYTLSVKFSDVYEDDAFEDALDEIDLSEIEDMGIDIEELLEEMKDIKIVYIFNKEYQMIGMRMENFELDLADILGSALSELGMGSEVEVKEVTLSFNCEIKIDHIGQIDEDDVKVPKKIKEEAVEEDELFEDMFDDDFFEDEDERYENEDDNEDEYEDKETPVVTEPTINIETVTGNSWNAYKFYVNGEEFALPADYAVFKEKTGYHMKSADEKSFLEAGYSTYVEILDDNDETVCYIDIANPTDEDLQYIMCPIIAIAQDDFDVEYSGVQIIFAGGLKVGDVTSKEALIAMFGEPADIYEYRSDDAEYSEYDSDTYTWAESDYTSWDYFKIVMNVKTGVIEEISTEHSGWIE